MRDSSLSACIQSIVAAEVGHLDLAYDYFRESAFIDFAILAGNTAEGVHLASLPVPGFGRRRLRWDRDHGDTFAFTPRLPDCSRVGVPFDVPRAALRVESARAQYATSSWAAIRWRFSITENRSVWSSVCPGPPSRRPLVGEHVAAGCKKNVWSWPLLGLPVVLGAGAVRRERALRSRSRRRGTRRVGSTRCTTCTRRGSRTGWCRRRSRSRRGSACACSRSPRCRPRSSENSWFFAGSNS